MQRYEFEIKDKREKRKILYKAQKSILSVAHHKGIVHITYPVTEERLACLALGNNANVVKVVRTLTAVASGCAVLQDKRLGNVKVIVAV